MPSEREIKGTMNTCTSNEVTIIEYTQHTCKIRNPRKKIKINIGAWKKRRKRFPSFLILACFSLAWDEKNDSELLFAILTRKNLRRCHKAWPIK